MKVERAGAFVEVAREIVQVNPRTALDSSCRMANTDAEFDNRLAHTDVAQREFVPARNLFCDQNFTGRSADDFNRSGRRIVNQRGDVVRRLDLKGARFHGSAEHRSAIWPRDTRGAMLRAPVANAVIISTW